MPAPSYATRADLYRYGLSAGLLSRPGRVVAKVHPTTDIFELDAHGFEDGDPVLFRADVGGALPYPLVDGTTYYVRRVSDGTFKVAATETGGSQLDIVNEGVSVIVAASLEGVVDAALEHYSRLVDTYLPAHLVPLEEPYPTVIVNGVAELAAAKVLAQEGRASEQILANAEQTRRELARLARGIPLRDTRATGPANIAIARNVGASGGGWGGTLP